MTRKVGFDIFSFRLEVWGMAKLLGTQVLEETIKSAILSGRVKRTDVMPSSLLLIAPFERGKTSIALRNCGEKALILSDLSGIGLLQALQLHPAATHIIINDLTVVTGHKSSVSTLTIAILNALAEEGCYNIALPQMTYLRMEERKVGIIACGIPQTLNDNRTWWKKSGFTSRMLVLQYDHSAQLSMKIMQSIANDNGLPRHEKEETVKIPEAHIYVDISAEMSAKIVDITHVMRESVGEIGYRKQKQLRSLACGHALLRSWKNPVVNDKDIEFLEELLPFIVRSEDAGVKML